MPGIVAFDPNLLGQVKSIARLRMAGCLMAISLSPEARQLIDEVPSVYVLGKNELLTFMPEAMRVDISSAVPCVCRGRRAR